MGFGWDDRLMHACSRCDGITAEEGPGAGAVVRESLRRGLNPSITWGQNSCFFFGAWVSSAYFYVCSNLCKVSINEICTHASGTQAFKKYGAVQAHYNDHAMKIVSPHIFFQSFPHIFCSKYSLLKFFFISK